MHFGLLARQVAKTVHKWSCKVCFDAVRREASTVISMTSFVDKQLDLLEIEHLAEIEENNLETANLPLKILQRKGICIPKLIINSLETGLYDRSIATFSLRTVNKTFPFNILSTGDIVKLNHSEEEKNTNGEEFNGIVTKVSNEQISVAFDSLTFRDTLDSLNQHGKSVALIKVANKVTYERLKHAMKDLSNYSTGPAQHLIEVLFGESSPSCHQYQECTLLNKELNEIQRKAVSFALAQREVAIIHGPPGTGKTTTMIEIIAQLVMSGQKVLACAPSNVAVDNLLEKLSAITIESPGRGFDSKSYTRKIKLVRLGHPARILNPRLQEMSLDALISRSGAASIIRDVRTDIERVQEKLRRCHDKTQRRKLQQERKYLHVELRKREKKAIRDIVSPSDVVLATNVGAYPRGPLQNLSRKHFDVIVIDECGQALEAACWIPLLLAKKCILAGDHLQLSPTIVSNDAAEEGLSVTLLERLIKLHGDEVVCMLTEQYRMHQLIMEWSSNKMYDGKLTAHSSVKTHLISDLHGIESNENTSIPILLIDTAGCDMGEAESEESDSKANEGEAKIVFQHVMRLLEAGLGQEDIAVISPYNLQVDIIRHFFHDTYPRVEVKSVDGFQGREKEAVVLSLVRSNVINDVGFLSDNRRLNVAVTRARRHLAVICDSDTVSKHDFIKSLLDHITEHGEVRSGFEYLHDNELEEHGVFDCISSFHLISPVVEPSKSTKTSKNTSASSMPKTKRVKPGCDVKSRDKVKPTPIDPELKKVYESIVTNYHRQFFPIFSETGHNESDYSGALDIEVVENENKIIFPQTLTSVERKTIHEICDDLGLAHESVGEGKDRKITVTFTSKHSPKLKVANTDALESSEVPLETPTSRQERSEDDSGTTEAICGGEVAESDIDAVAVENDVISEDPALAGTDASSPTSASSPSSASASSLVPVHSDPHTAYFVCEKCGKSLPKDNLELHVAHCERLIKMKLRIEASQNSPVAVKPRSSAKSSKANKGKKPKSKSSSKQKMTEDDFDSLINEAQSFNRSCFLSNCSESVTTTGQLCKTCKRCFCLSHCIPEVHGCGRNATVEARRQISRDGVLYAGSGVPNRRPAPEKRAQMKNKLSSKLKTMEGARKSTNKEKK